MNVSKNWLWCQYTPGAGGKTVCCMLQLSTNVHRWDNLIADNIKKFTQSKISIDFTTHLQNEPHWPYELSWYTRQLPFTRGDNLSNAEVDKLYAKNNKTYNKILTMQWNKPYFPIWFKGTAIRIVNDKDSIEFLKKRRDAIFYRWENNIVHFKRFLPEGLHFGTSWKQYKDNPNTFKEYQNKKEFYEDELYNNPEFLSFCKDSNADNVKLNINLSDFWKKSGAEIATEINNAFNFDIDLKKANYILDVWLKNNVNFLP